jgi:hypothetical protein
MIVLFVNHVGVENTEMVLASVKWEVSEWVLENTGRRVEVSWIQ